MVEFSFAFRVILRAKQPIEVAEIRFGEESSMPRTLIEISVAVFLTQPICFEGRQAGRQAGGQEASAWRRVGPVGGRRGAIGRS